VPRVKYDGDVGVGTCVFELADGTFEVQVSYVLNSNTSNPACLDIAAMEACIVGQVGKLGDVLIGRIADHQGNAFVNLAADNQQTTCRTGKSATRTCESPFARRRRLRFLANAFLMF
jgi:hypothetical protein